MNTVISAFRTSWINSVFFRIVPDPILAPLPDIAVHVVQTKSVRWESTYWSSLLPICTESNREPTFVTGVAAIVIGLHLWI